MLKWNEHVCHLNSTNLNSDSEIEPKHTLINRNKEKEEEKIINGTLFATIYMYV